MNRPRHSLLSLFDPLAAPQTPPSHFDEDKENFTPFSALFTRSNNHNPSTPVPPLKKRLVDVGDATLDDSSILDLLTEEQEPLSASVTCLETPVPPFQRRTPLARPPLGDANPTPVARFKPHSSPFLLSQATPNAISTFNANETNLPEILVSSCHSVNNQQSQHTIDLDPSSTLPHPPQADCPFQGDTESSTRLCAPSIASHRLSIDLHASFQMHFQSNSSFDLLNDNISLTEPMESLLADDENFDFELERENLRDAMTKFKKEFTPSKRRICMSHRLQSVLISSPSQRLGDCRHKTIRQIHRNRCSKQSATLHLIRTPIVNLGTTHFNRQVRTAAIRNLRNFEFGTTASPRGDSQDLPTSPLDGKSSKRQCIPCMCGSFYPRYAIQSLPQPNCPLRLYTAVQ